MAALSVRKAAKSIKGGLLTIAARRIEGCIMGIAETQSHSFGLACHSSPIA